MQAWLARMENEKHVVEFQEEPGLVFDLRYAQTGNFTGESLYCGETRVFLQESAAAKLRNAIHLLQQEHPGYSLVIWDATRPRFAQEAMRRHVQGTPYLKFVSDPKRGSLHSFGMAVDVSLQDPDGKLLDMGTDFDSFSTKASAKRANEERMVKQGQLSRQQVNNRHLLRDLMLRAGFIQLGSEWWHYNAARTQWVRTHMRMLGEPRRERISKTN